MSVAHTVAAGLNAQSHFSSRTALISCPTECSRCDWAWRRNGATAGPLKGTSVWLEPVGMCWWAAARGNNGEVEGARLH